MRAVKAVKRTAGAVALIAAVAIVALAAPRSPEALRRVIGLFFVVRVETHHLLDVREAGQRRRAGQHAGAQRRQR